MATVAGQDFTDNPISRAITDAGPGIPSDQQALIFERFTRLDPARSRRQGGSISMYSSLGEDADFIVRLPAAA
jgi:signal transduction histidine kinase